MTDTNLPDAEDIPGAFDYAKQLADMAEDQYEAYRAEIITKALESLPDHPDFSQPVDTGEQLPVFSQPGNVKPTAPEVVPMSDLGLEITHRVKEMFHGFSNRQERSQQTTLGPSEIGHPCDRRIAMSLMRIPPVNPGGDNWASWMGTQGHAGLAEMIEWANAGSGRYAAEVRLKFPSEHVPKGTTDLVDRTLLLAGDWKFQGKWSRRKLKAEGPSPTYRVQLHTYALGLVEAGEKIEHVALISMPRDESSLDDMYVWTEPYDPKVALDALARVDRIASEIGPMKPDGDWSKARPEDFPIDNSDCKYCRFYQPDAPASTNGVCNGKGV